RRGLNGINNEQAGKRPGSRRMAGARKDLTQLLERAADSFLRRILAYSAGGGDVAQRLVLKKAQQDRFAVRVAQGRHGVIQAWTQPFPLGGGWLGHREHVLHRCFFSRCPASLGAEKVL